MNLLDTTVLVYAVGEDHPKRDACRRVIEAIADGRLNATTTVEAIQEFVHVRARRRSRSDAADLGRAYATLLSPLIAPTPEDLREGLRIFESDSAIGAFDAVLAAVATTRGVRLISVDGDFRSVRGLDFVDPSTVGFDELLGSS